MDVIKDRHSVRQYSDKKIEKEKRDALMTAVAQCNAGSGLHIQILFDEPKCFSGMESVDCEICSVSAAAVILPSLAISRKFLSTYISIVFLRSALVFLSV